MCYVDRFSAGLDDLTRKQQASRVEVLRKLKEIKRYSIFEATENKVIAKTMDQLVRAKLIKTDNSCGYPWINVTLTEDGERMIGGAE